MLWDPQVTAVQGSGALGRAMTATQRSVARLHCKAGRRVNDCHGNEAARNKCMWPLDGHVATTGSVPELGGRQAG